MRLWKYGKKLNALTEFNRSELGVGKQLLDLWVLGKNGIVGYVEGEGDIRGDKSTIIRWMHGGRSEWFTHLLDLDVLTEEAKFSPMPEEYVTTDSALSWHATAPEILRAGKIASISVVPGDDRPKSECFAYLKAIGSENDAIQILFDNGCEIVIYDQNNQLCCEKRFIETADDLQSFVGESFVKLDIIDVEKPEDKKDDKGYLIEDYTEQTFVRLQTNRDHATFNIYNLSNGHYGELDAGVCVYVPHPVNDRPNTPYLRSPTDNDHTELTYNLNTQLQRLGINRDQVDHLIP